MKKFLTIAIVSASLLLTGCAAETVEESTIESLVGARPTLSQTEIAMLDKFGVSSFLSRYDSTYEAISKSRIKFGQEIIVRSDTEVPFCDVLSVLLADEDKSGQDDRSYSLNNQWKASYGITLQEQCREVAQTSAAEYEDALVLEQELLKAEIAIDGTDTVVTKDEVLVANVIEDTVIIDDEALLSPSMVRELRQSITDCNRAKVKLMGIMDQGEPLTTSHYNEVEKLNLQCEMHLLEVEING
ncbi:membrane lipoprotein [Vibrio phage 1.081.O._10N.286.52.C2]|nr:membrane lipoprotein [Vibrio phage 1.081.O._10N.286.52.C2]